LLLQGGVDLSYLRWVRFDGIRARGPQWLELHRARLRSARGGRLLRSLTARFNNAALIGAGTVLSADEARMCVDAGAQFIVSPGLDLGTIDAAHALDEAVAPGALTPTEVIRPSKAGADMVKIFPCSAVGGAKYLNALKGPLPHVKLLPTGGISVSNAHEFIAAGAAAIAVGSELVNVAALMEGRDAELTARARELVRVVAAARTVHSSR
jgi:2-dehydro-3-deoxyphosphogluconate aldolase/(4S)-4-hydroxy-2-oxoglutarate aldolase